MRILWAPRGRPLPRACPRRLAPLCLELKRIKKQQSFEKWSVLAQTLCQVRRTEDLNALWSLLGLPSCPLHLKFSVMNL